MMDFTAMPAIAVVCYLVAHTLKQTTLDNKWLPSICGVLGGLIGFVSYRFGWIAIPANDPLTAVVIGIVSGLAATGSNELFKQTFKKDQ